MNAPSIAGYEILGPLGEGGMGQVFKARDRRLERLVALKLLSQRLSRDAIAHTRFLQEARMAASVEHPNVCSIFEIGEDDGGGPFIAIRGYDQEAANHRSEAAATLEDITSRITDAELRKRFTSVRQVERCLAHI